MYYCTRCRRWHNRGSIARKHRVFAKQIRKPIKTRKKSAKHIFIKPKRQPLKKPTGSLSKRRRGQLRMKATDPYQRQLIKKLMQKTGMTYFQIKNLINLDPHDDIVDIETEISSASGHSNDPLEVYEYAKKKIVKKIRRAGKYEYGAREIQHLEDKYAFQWEGYQRSRHI